MFANISPVRRSLLWFGVLTLLLSVVNCSSKSSGGGGGTVNNASTLSATYSPTPAVINIAVTIVVTGGVAPYTITKVSGAGTLTGLNYLSSTVETAVFQIRDSSGGSPIQLNIPVLQNGSSVQPVTPGFQVFTNTGAFNFTIPNHNNLYVEVWGAGAGGQHCFVSNGFPVCLYGNNGGDSTFGSLTGGGGRGVNGGQGSGGTYNENGDNGNWNGTNCPGLGGGAGGPYRYLTRSAQGPGGGGDGYCISWGANGGGGGGYTAKAYARGIIAVGSVMAGRVGAGGGGGGANGMVRISWD